MLRGGKFYIQKPQIQQKREKKKKGAASDNASDDEDDDDAEFLARMRNRSDPAVKMLHNLGFGDGDEEPSEVA